MGAPPDGCSLAPVYPNPIYSKLASHLVLLPDSDDIIRSHLSSASHIGLTLRSVAACGSPGSPPEGREFPICIFLL